MRSKRPQDAFGYRARREGYPARSVYKLEEIDRRARMFRRGQRVLDLGAYPGSWTLYAATRVGAEGRVLGLDRTPHRGALPPNAVIREADLLTLDLARFREEEGEFDVVMSDMAPSTTGHRSVDQARSFELFMIALRVADGVVADGGSFVGKIFQSGAFPDAKRAVEALFAETRVVRPKAVRTESVETFLVGKGRRPRAPTE